MKLLSLARDLKRRRGRERRGLFSAEGVRVVEELFDAGLAVHGILAAPSLSRTPRGVALLERATRSGTELAMLAESDFASVAETESSQGVLAIAAVPTRDLASLELPPRTRLLVLDAVQDPGNVGTLLRTAAAFGVTATIVLPGTVDVWNPKVVRSAMGALFRHPPVVCTPEGLLTFLAERDVELWGADALGESLGARPVPARVAIALGNEGGGLTPAVRDSASHLVSLPLAAGIESLNVAVAAGILLHELRQ